MEFILPVIWCYLKCIKSSHGKRSLLLVNALHSRIHGILNAARLGKRKIYNRRKNSYEVEHYARNKLPSDA